MLARAIVVVAASMWLAACVNSDRLRSSLDGAAGVARRGPTHLKSVVSLLEFSCAHRPQVVTFLRSMGGDSAT